MIQIYNKGNTNFIKNGDSVITPVECIVDTSSWEMSLSHLIDDEGKWKYILEDSVIKAPSFNGVQLFRIYWKVVNDSQVEAKAKPIFFDSKDDCMLIDVRPTNKNGKQALDIMTKGSKYSGESDIVTRSTAYYVLKNLLEAITGDDENSFLNRWGGEVMYDNYKVIINRQLGANRGISLLYGKNIPTNGLSEEVDLSEVVTRIIPKAFNGYTLSGNAPWVDSKIIGNYPKIRAKIIEYNDIKLKSDVSGEEEGITVCNTMNEVRNELIKKCNTEFSNGIDKPKITIEASMVLLKNTTEYENYKVLETVSLGDTIACKHDVLGISTNERVINLVYDCVLDCVESVTLGTQSYDYLNDVSSTINSVSKVIDKSNDTILADKITGIIDASNTQMRYQKDIAKKQDVRAILFEDIDPNSQTYGACCIGSMGFQVANKKTPDGLDWDWSTFCNADGIVAEMICAGIIYGMQLEAGTIKGSVIEGSKIIGGELNINNKFTVDKNGKADISEGIFRGDISTEKDAVIGGQLQFLPESEDIKFISFGKALIVYDHFENTGLYGINNQVVGEGGKSASVSAAITNVSSSVTLAASNNGSASMINLIDSNITFSGNTRFYHNMQIYKDLYVYGSKNRVIKDKVEGNILMNAVESAGAVFEDFGTAQLDDKGKCIVRLEKRFLATINAKENYFVFISALGEGNIFVKRKYNFAFIVQGTPMMKFDWRITAKQKGYEESRMDELVKERRKQ